MVTRSRSVPYLFLLGLKSFHAADIPENDREHGNIRRRRQQQQSCHPSKKYHTHMSLSATCINDNVYPPSWDKPPMSETFFFDDPVKCCDFYFKGFDSCGKIDVCGGATTGSPTTRPTIGPTGQQDQQKPSPTHGPTVASADPNQPYVYPPDNPCYSRKWHPDTATILPSCTNNLDYPTSWNNGIMDGITMFNDPLACCEKLKTSIRAADCLVREDELCGVKTTSPTTGPTAKPVPATSKPTVRPSQPSNDGNVSCSNTLWHPDSTFKGCTNSPKGTYPNQWDEPDMASRYFFDSFDGCCAGFFKNRECIKTDLCPVVPEDCSGLKWHPTTSFKACTNSLDYPPSWANPPMSDNYMHDTYEDCCYAVFSGRDCPKVDVCEPVEEVPCSELMWHPTTDFKTCTNSQDFPSTWANPPMSDNYMHATYEQCCSAIFAGRVCPKADVCEPEIPCSQQVWHPTTNFQTCTNSKDFPPTWTMDTFLHLTYEACCLAVFDQVPCPKDDVCPTSDGAVSTTPYPSSKPTTSQPIVSGPTTHGPTLQPFTSGPTSISGNQSTTLTTGAPTVRPSKRPTTMSPTSKPIVCIPAKWHPAKDRTCSNSPVYNELWDLPSLSVTYLHDTHARCCTNFYGLETCGKEDICNPENNVPYSTSSPSTRPTPKPSSHPTQKPSNDWCSLKKFHPISVFNRKCTNDDHYPPLWNSMTSTYFFTTAEECCYAFYRDGSCEIVDTCLNANRTAVNDTNCGKKWHPTTEINRVCSNGDNYPPLWDSIADQYLFTTAKECCDTFYSKGNGQCDIVNTC